MGLIRINYNDLEKVKIFYTKLKNKKNRFHKFYKFINRKKIIKFKFKQTKKILV